MTTTINEEVDRMFGPIDWCQTSMGYMVCPGEEFHSAPSGHKDCVIYTNKVPTITCFHTSCKGEVESANIRLRKGLSDGAYTHSKRTKEQLERIKHRKALEHKERRLASNKEQILETYAWPVQEIIESSPNPIVNEWGQFLSLYDDDDVLWCGQPFHSGAPKYKKNFQPTAHWRRLPEPPYPFICGSTFKPDTHCRSKDFVMKRKFLCVEMDSLHIVPEINKDLSGAVFKYIQDVYGWTLRCVVDAGRRSLHGHYDFPGENEVLWANVVLPALNVDTATLRPTQPTRAPGRMRDNGQPQRLLWIN